MITINPGEVSRAAEGRSFQALLEDAVESYGRHEYRKAHVLCMAAALIADFDSPEMDWALSCAGLALEVAALLSRPDPDLEPAVLPPVVLDPGIPVYRQREDGGWDGPILGEAPPGSSWVRAGSPLHRDLRRG